VKIRFFIESKIDPVFVPFIKKQLLKCFSFTILHFPSSPPKKAPCGLLLDFPLAITEGEKMGKLADKNKEPFTPYHLSLLATQNIKLSFKLKQ